MAEEVSEIDYLAFERVDVRVGVIRAVTMADGCRLPAYKLEIDFGGDVGWKRSIAQATNYSIETLIGKQVLAVVNLKPRQVGKHISEVLVLGVPTLSKGTALAVPDMEAVVGSRLF